MEKSKIFVDLRTFSVSQVEKVFAVIRRSTDSLWEGNKGTNYLNNKDLFYLHLDTEFSDNPEWINCGMGWWRYINHKTEINFQEFLKLFGEEPTEDYPQLPTFEELCKKVQELEQKVKQYEKQIRNIS